MSKQIADQYRVAAALARIIAKLADDKALGDQPALEVHGTESAQWMETLGNLLNNADANDDSDDWMHPIFEKAQEMYPTEH